MQPSEILVVRLSAMGDVIHALPAVATLKRSFPSARIAWAIKPCWAMLLANNPYVDRVLPLDRPKWRPGGVRFDLAMDFQGLLKSALTAFAARPAKVLGFDWPLLRERAAGIFYCERVASGSGHVVDRNLDLAAAAGAHRRTVEFPLPDFPPEGEWPASDFVLASPAAGWGAKQWPPDHYARLAGLLWKRTGLPLVINCSPADRPHAEAIVRAAPSGACVLNVSSVAGLIGVTRRARAVIGVDSGPLHLAAALGKPGVALFGPTDPDRNGPYGDTFTVLRAPGAVTTYQRHSDVAPAMRALEPPAVTEALEARLARHAILEPHT
jgi:heptosyltransferase-1